MRFTIPTSLTVFSEVKALFHAIHLFLYWQQKYYMNWTEKKCVCVTKDEHNGLPLNNSLHFHLSMSQSWKKTIKCKLCISDYFFSAHCFKLTARELTNSKTERPPNLTIWQQTKQNNTHVPHANINASNGVDHLNILYCRHYIDS